MYRGKKENEKFAFLLREMLRKHKFTQRNLGIICGYGHTAASKWATGRSLPNLNSVLLACEYIKATDEERSELVKEFLLVKTDVTINISHLRLTDKAALIDKYIELSSSFIYTRLTIK